MLAGYLGHDDLADRNAREDSLPVGGDISERDGRDDETVVGFADEYGGTAMNVDDCGARNDLKDQPQARSGGRRGVTAPRRCLDRTIHPIPFEYGDRARRLRAAGRPGRRVRVQVLEELVRIDGSSVGDQRIWRLDDLEMHVRRIAESGARIVGIAAAFR